MLYHIGVGTWCIGNGWNTLGTQVLTPWCTRANALVQPVRGGRDVTEHLKLFNIFTAALGAIFRPQCVWSCDDAQLRYMLDAEFSHELVHFRV